MGIVSGQVCVCVCVCTRWAATCRLRFMCMRVRLATRCCKLVWYLRYICVICISLCVWGMVAALAGGVGMAMAVAVLVAFGGVHVCFIVGLVSRGVCIYRRMQGRVSLCRCLGVWMYVSVCYVRV
jgi:hypothetical protein